MAVSNDNETRVVLFQSIGLNEQKARETLKNVDVTRVLEATINEVTIFFCFLFDRTSTLFEKSFQAKVFLPKENSISKSIGNLLYSLSTRSKNQIQHLHRYLIKYICEEKIKNEPQLLGCENEFDEKLMSIGFF